MRSIPEGAAGGPVVNLTDCLIRRFERFRALGATEVRALESAVSARHRFDSRDTLVKRGDPADRIFVILDGFACRYKLLPDGRRQILSYLISGDMCDPRTFVLPRMDHSIAALCTVHAAILSRESVERLERHPALAEAMAWNALAHQSIMREWLVNIGNRTSFERISHLFCEIFERLQVVGLATENSCDLPLTQLELADTLALSSVHVNRTLMELRRSGLVTFQNRHLVIHDIGALRAAGGFDPAYLHLDGARAIAA